MTSLAPVRVAAILCLLVAWPARAQHWTFQKYGPEQGLTNSNILALQQDPKGYLWVSTEGGLFRYDGDRFKSFPAEAAAKRGDILDFYTSADGQLWAGSAAGLLRWNGETFVPVPGFEDAVLETRQSIGGDAKNLYLATRLGIRSMPLQGGEPGQQISTQPSSTVLAASDGTLWFSCGTLLCSTRDGREREWGPASGVKTGPWFSILEDAAKRLWIRSSDRVLMRPAGSPDFRQVVQVDATHGPMLRSDGSGNVMIPHAGGLMLCREDRCTNYGPQSGLRKAEVISATTDREGSVWIGYSGQGLARWVGREQWQSYTEMEGLTDTGGWRIVRDSSGGLWIGTNRGLFEGRQQNGRWLFRRSGAVGQRTVYGLAAETDGSLWIATYQPEANGLVRYYPATGEKVIYPPESPSTRLWVTQIHRDAGGTIWVATPAKLLRLSPGSTTLKPFPLPLDGASINDLKSQGPDLFVAGRKGLYVDRPAGRRLLTMQDGLKDNNVQSISIGPDGALWLTYFSSAGITRIDFVDDQCTMRHFTTESGLPANVVYSQFFDAAGRHWLGTDNGVAVQQGDRWIAYDASDGLVWNDCNAHSFLAESDGAVWIGTSNGLSRYTPSSGPAQLTPRTLITEVLRNDRPALGTDFDAQTQLLTIRYTMLSYVRLGTRFRYRIGTGSTPWTEIRGHEVRFAELPHGRYRFEVQGETPTGGWGRPAVLEFRVRPIWFLSLPFLGSLCGLVSVLLWQRWRRREKRQRAIRAELEARVLKRTLELQEEVRAKEAANGLAESLLQRDRIVESVRVAAQLFLSVAGWQTVILEVLAKTGVAAQACRVFVCECHLEETQRLSGRVRSEWVAPGTECVPLGENADAAWLGAEMERAASLLRRGELVLEPVSNPLRAMPSGPKSSILIPIDVAGHWFGFLAFEDYCRGRNWSDADKDGFRAVAGMLGASITRQQAQEELVKARDAAEEASRAKSTFLANMSHELRTPLNAIIGYSQMLAEDCGTTAPAHFRADLEKIERSGQMLLSLISDILDISKIEAGRMELKLQSIDIAPVLQDVRNTLLPMAVKCGNALEVYCPEEVSRGIGDLAKFRQSLFNLVNNACKFTENGKVTVTVEEIQQDRRAFVAVRVADTGIGIGEEHLKKLFQPFSQVDNSTTRKFGGTGLGLAISQKFCQMMGGDILVESEPGRGSRFSILLPAARRDPGR